MWDITLPAPPADHLGLRLVLCGQLASKGRGGQVASGGRNFIQHL